MRVPSGWSRGVAVAAAVACVAVPAGAQVRTFQAVLNGANESPAVPSPGTGVFTASYDPSTFMLGLTVTFSGLLPGTPNSPNGSTNSHIHCCTAPGTNTGVSTPLPSFPGFPSGVLAGTYSNTFDLSVASAFNPAFVTAQGGLENARNALLAGMTDGRAYLNIHSTLYPGGEIRGFITATPEPSTWVLMATGLLAIGGVGARRRSRR